MGMNECVQMEGKMKLKELLMDMEYKCLQGSMEKDISTLVYDSRKAEPGAVFVCICGAVRDGHE